MKSAILLSSVVLVGLSGCLGEPDIVSKHGARIYFTEPGITWTQEQVDAREDLFLERMADVGLQYGYGPSMVKSVLADTVVLVQLEDWECADFGRCAGEQDGNVLRVEATGCVSTSAYAHEVLHFVQQRFFHFADFKHENTELWRIANAVPRSCTR